MLSLVRTHDLIGHALESLPLLAVHARGYSRYARNTTRLAVALGLLHVSPVAPHALLLDTVFFGFKQVAKIHHVSPH
jgi:hypothetical protein